MCEDTQKMGEGHTWRLKYLSMLKVPEKKQKWTFHPLYRKQEILKNRFEIDTAEFSK